MDIVRSILVEVRERLRCCSVFIKTSNLAQGGQFRVVIRPDGIVLNHTQLDRRRESSSSCDSRSEDDSTHYSKFMDMKAFCKLIPGSLSSLKIENNFVSFRVLTEPCGPDSSGNFFTEHIREAPNFQNDNDASQKESVIVNLNKNVLVKLVCANCSNCITADKKETMTVAFERILELPSDNLDMSDWFCHGPSGEHCHSSSIDSPRNGNSSKFEPHGSDLFYGLCYFTVHSSNFVSKFKDFNKKRNILHCMRCLSWLGVKSADLSFKFWNSCIKFSLADKETAEDDFHLFSYNIPDCAVANNFALLDFLFTVKRLIRDSSIGIQTLPACKLLLDCDTKGNEKQFMLIWVMDKNLDVLKHKGGLSNDTVIHLKRGKTAKLLYRVEESATLGFAEEWSKEIGVLTCSISPLSLTAAVQYLKNNAAHLPQSCRLSNEFSVSYLSI